MTVASVSSQYSHTLTSALSSKSNEFAVADILDYTNTDKISYEDFKNGMISHYGKILFEELEEEYGPYKEATITIEEVKQRLISIAALVRKEDLEELFDEIHSGTSRLDCANHLTAYEEDEIRKVSSFEKLNDSHLEILLSVYRYFPNAKYDRQAIGSLFFPLKKYPKISNQPKVFQKHLTMIRAFERADHFIQDKKRKNAAFRQKLAATEHLCREIAYGVPLNHDLEKQINLLKKQKLLTPPELKQAIEDLIEKEVVGTIFPCLNDKGEKIFYEIRSSVFEKGLVAFFCAPLTKGQWQTHDDTPCPMKAIFRGTWCFSSLKRDLTEGLEVGKNSFFGLSPSIIERLEEGIPDDVEQVSLEALGHSLGGVDASRLVALLAKIRVERQRELGEDYESKLDTIRAIKLVTWNSPGVLKSTCNEYNENVAEIKQNPILPLTFRHLHIKVGEDVFQNLGKTMLGWINPQTVKKPKKAIRNSKTTIVKFHFKRFYTIIGTTWFAHRLPCLSVEAKANRMNVSRGNINHKLGPRSVCSWIKLIAKAIFRRSRRIPIALFRVCKRAFVKEVKKDYHRVYKLLAIRKIFRPNHLEQSTPSQSLTV